VDLHKVAALLPEPRRQQLESTLSSPSVQAVLSFEATVDDDGRLSTLTVNGTEQKTVLRYFDYGVVVDVVKPPEAETVEG
jgi:hypothetical protein